MLLHVLRPQLIIRTLDARWSEFTRRRGGNQSTGVTDLGVFIDWASLYMQPLDTASGKPHYRRTEHEATVFADALTQVAAAILWTAIITAIIGHAHATGSSREAL